MTDRSSNADISLMNGYIPVPDQVKYILKELEDRGYEAYAVGGCVRDMMLGRIPNDWDITTNAMPREVKRIFGRTVDTGIKHGTVTVMIEKNGYEVTTYRVDGKYLDGRHPESVRFTGSLAEDLKRRDFTINAMAYNPRTGIVDLFGGRDDLDAHIVRCVGNPDERFSEDALRIMRAVRFCGQLNFDLDPSAFSAIKNHLPALKLVSAERIRTELVKLISSDNSEKLRMLYETGITSVILPEFDICMKCPQETPHHIYDVGDHIIRSVANINFFFIYRDKLKNNTEDPEEFLNKYISSAEHAGKMTESQCAKFENAFMKVLENIVHVLESDEGKMRETMALTMLLHDIEKPRAKKYDKDGTAHFKGHPAMSADKADEILKRLKFDNSTRILVTRLVRYHDYRFSEDKRLLRHALSKIGTDIIHMLVTVEAADVLAQNPDMFGDKFHKLFEGLRDTDEIIQEKVPLKVRDLKINGKDLISLGIAPGPGIGNTLEALLDRVLDDPGLNDHETLIKLAAEFKDMPR